VILLTQRLQQVGPAGQAAGGQAGWSRDALWTNPLRHVSHVRAPGASGTRLLLRHRERILRAGLEPGGAADRSGC
jgi:hypothetical protein